MEIEDFFKFCKKGLNLQKIHKYTPESASKTIIITVFLALKNRRFLVPQKRSFLGQASSHYSGLTLKKPYNVSPNGEKGGLSVYKRWERLL